MTSATEQMRDLITLTEGSLGDLWQSATRTVTGKVQNLTAVEYGQQAVKQINAAGLDPQEKQALLRLVQQFRDHPRVLATIRNGMIAIKKNPADKETVLASLTPEGLTRWIEARR